MITARTLMPTLICSTIGCGFYMYEAFLPNEDVEVVREINQNIIPQATPYYFKDPGLERELSPKELIRLVRYDVEGEPIKAYYHHGKTPMDERKLRNTIHAVLSYLPQVKAGGNMEKLVFETAKVETEGGYFAHVWRSKGDYGVFQVRKSTVKDTLSWLKSAHPDVYRAVLAFYDKSKSFEYNLDHNVPFGTALCATYYWRVCPEKGLSTKNARAKVWKEHYNTVKGKGSVAAYLKRNKEQV